jgi:transposase
MHIYHKLDKRIRAHVFMLVIEMLFYKYIQCKVEKESGKRVSIDRLIAQLSRIKMGGLITFDDNARKTDSS